MQARILSFLQSHPSHFWNAREISTHLKIDAEERKVVRNLLKKMAQAGHLVRHRGNRYGLAQAGQTLTGTLKLHPQGYGFVLPEDPHEKDVFIPARFMGEGTVSRALPSDKVLVSYVSKEDDSNRREGKILKILERGRSHWVGRLEKRGRSFYVVNEEYKRPIEILISARNLKGARSGQTVVARLIEYPQRGLPQSGVPQSGVPFMGEIISVLGEPFEESTETSAVLIKHHIIQDFPRSVLEEVGKLPDKIPQEEYDKRVDLKSKPIITIDGLTARDFDDAICVEKKEKGYHLTVSIADVAYYVSSGSLTDREALNRGTSVYFPDFAVPMLPEKLSNNLCSLKAGEDRPALTCEIRFNEEGVANEAWFYESVIRSQKRGIYDEIQRFFDGVSFSEEEYSPAVRESLNHAKKLAQLSLVQRQKRGTIDFELPEAEIVYNQSGEIIAIARAKRFFSHQLIEEFMIAANRAVAELFQSLKIPLLYRVHDFPDPDKVQVFLDLLHDLGIKKGKFHLAKPADFTHLLESVKSHPMELFLHQVLLRSMKIAVYDQDNRGHFGLALKDYCHFTSPIRRYPDLTVHRQLKTLLRQSAEGKIHLSLTTHKKDLKKQFRSFYSQDQLVYIGDVASKRERESMEAEREMMGVKRALFMQKHLQEKFFGTIRRVAKFGMFVELEPHYVEGLLHVRELHDDYYIFDEKRFRLVGRKRRKKSYSVGDRIWVVVKEVMLAQREILLALPD